MVRILACALAMTAVAGCSSSSGPAGDDCQRAAAKLRPLVEERAVEHGELPAGRHLTDAAKDREVARLADQCRTRRREHPDDPMPGMRCVLAAADDAAVRACVDAARK